MTRRWLMVKWATKTALVGALALCLVCLALGIRSCFVADSFQHQWYERSRVHEPSGLVSWGLLTQRSWFIMHASGSVCICRDWLRSSYGGQPGVPPDSTKFYRQRTVAMPGIGDAHGMILAALGFRFRLIDDIDYQFYEVVVPYWALVLTTGSLSAVLFRHLYLSRRRQKWAAEGRCAACGYDLRAHQPGQRCPECGTPIPAPATSQSRV